MAIIQTTGANEHGEGIFRIVLRNPAERFAAKLLQFGKKDLTGNRAKLKNVLTQLETAQDDQDLLMTH